MRVVGRWNANIEAVSDDGVELDDGGWEGDAVVGSDKRSAC